MSSLTTLLASFLLVVGAPSVAEAKAPYCLPGNPCFPSPAVLKVFNATVDGRLIKTVPYGAPCYKATYNAEQCKALAKNKVIPEWRVTLPAALQYTNFELDENNKGCLVPSLKPDGSAPDPIDGPCTLGGTSHYVVNATNADHIAKAVQFASIYNLRFRVKNTGHCYTGRSSGEGSFSVWTHHMKDPKFIKGFVPSKSKAAPQDVIVTGPGANVIDLYEAGAKNGVVTIGGFSPTVGAAGGYVLGGGAGPFANYFGLGVDNTVQFEVVTADGQKKIANEAVNSDLYWALRGGGGAFAAVTKVYIKAYPAFKTINTVTGKLKCHSQESYAKLIDAIIDLQVTLFDLEHPGIWQTIQHDMTLSLLSFDMFTSAQAEKPAEDTLKPFDVVRSIPGCDADFKTYQTRGPSSWLDIYTSIVQPLAQGGAVVGVNLIDLSRIVMEDTMRTKVGRDKIKKYILEVPAPFIWQNAVGTAVSKVAPDATAIHPAWRKSFAFIDTPIFGKPSGLTEEAFAFMNSSSARLTDAFGKAVYYNEQYATGEEWQRSNFGSNYDRLLRIKKAVDPRGLFNCRNCVGSEGGF